MNIEVGDHASALITAVYVDEQRIFDCMRLDTTAGWVDRIDVERWRENRQIPPPTYRQYGRVRIEGEVPPQ